MATQNASRAKVEIRAVSKSPSSPVLQIMLRKFAHDYAADGVVADAMRDGAAEIDRLNEWADGMTDAMLKERRLADATITELQAKLAARPEARARLSAMPIVKTLKDQRDECADVLRRIRQWDMLDVAADGPYWKRELDAILAKCPSYTQQLRNVAEGIGMTYEELIEAVKLLPAMNSGSNK